MARWIQWYVLTRLTGSPIGSLLALVVIWWLSDRFTFQLLPDPLRLVARWRRRGELRGTLAANPHDRRARFELAQLLLDGRRPRQAIEVLRPNIEAGDDDVHTAFVMGAALARSGIYDQAERVLTIARQAEPSFRTGEIDLELGRMRLARGDMAGAREALERLLVLRPGTVEGRFYLARALVGLGDVVGAKRAKQEAWREYASLPRFRRRQERPIAWRIKPWRPAAVVVAAILAATVAAYWVLPALTPGQQQPASQDPYEGGRKT